MGRNNLMSFGVEYHLVDSCNLNCAGCSHYSSLLNKKTYPPLEVIIEDLKLLKDKVGDNLKWLRLLGGEPLIHPQINECLEKIRELFPKIRISLVTNGLLLEKMKQEFYDICLKHKIEIRITDYGIINVERIVNMLKERGIIANYFKKVNVWRYQHIRLTEDRIDCLENCTYKNTCINYRNGKLYLCPHIAYIEYFNDYFNKDIVLDKTDSISLEDIKSFNDLIEKLENTKPNFCYQYCNYYDDKHPKRGKWERTKKDINEFCLIS